MSRDSMRRSDWLPIPVAAVAWMPLVPDRCESNHFARPGLVYRHAARQSSMAEREIARASLGDSWLPIEAEASDATSSRAAMAAASHSGASLLHRVICAVAMGEERLVVIAPVDQDLHLESAGSDC